MQKCSEYFELYHIETDVIAATAAADAAKFLVSFHFQFDRIPFATVTHKYVYIVTVSKHAVDDYARVKSESEFFHFVFSFCFFFKTTNMGETIFDRTDCT